MKKKVFAVAALVTILLTGCMFEKSGQETEGVREVIQLFFDGKTGEEEKKEILYEEAEKPNPEKGWDSGDVLEKLEYLAASILDKVSAGADWEIQLTEEEKEAVSYYNLNEQGCGYLILNCFDGESLHERYVVYSTTDHGKNWCNQNTKGYEFGEILEVFDLNDHLFVFGRNGNNRAGYTVSFCVSHDRGQSFEYVNPFVIVDLEQYFMDFVFRPVLQESNPEEETFTLAWTSLKEEEEDYFLTAKYDINLNMMEEIQRNEAFYRIYRWDVDKEFLFKDSDRRFLTDEDVWELRQAHQLYCHCGYFVSEFKEILDYAINEIYYRNGYNFAGTEYEEYFADYSWYNWFGPEYEKPEFAQKDFNQFEQANVDLLAQYRNAETAVSKSVCYRP